MCYKVDMYVARIPNRGSPPAVLLRESYREGGKVKNRTLANLSHWPEHKVDALVRGLKGQPPEVDLSAAFEITRSLPHGHVAAVLATAQRLGLAELIDPTPSRRRDLVMAMLIAAVIAPDSKLATARGLRTETATSSLGEVLGVSGCDEDDLYAAMDWALARQERIENALAARHRVDGTLVLYDAVLGGVRGPQLPAGGDRVCPRRGQRPAPDRLRAAVHHRRGTGGHRGVRRQHRRRQDADRPNPQAHHPVRAEPGRPGRRPRHAHQCPHDRGAAPGSPGLAQRAARRPDQGLGGRRGAAAVAVRRAEPGGHHPPRLPRGAADRLPQPRPGRRT